MTQRDAPARVWAIVPAAGMSRRMGRDKQTLPFRDSTVVGVVVRAVRSGGAAGVVVVTRSVLCDQLDLPADDCVTVVINDDPATEMIDSVRLGLDHLRLGVNSPRRIAPHDGVLVIPGDMPTVSPGACRAAVDLFLSDPTRIVMATHSGKRGHPLIFPGALIDAVHALSGGLNELIRDHERLVTCAPTDDPGVLRDLDTPEDYADAN